MNSISFDIRIKTLVTISVSTLYTEESKDGVYPMASDNGGPGRTALTLGDALYTEGSKDGVYPMAAENGAEGSPA